MKNFEELTRLVETYGGIVIVKILQKRGRPSAKTFLGTGKAEEISQLARELKADLILHVIDAADPEIEHKIKVVEDILTQLNCEMKPKIYVLNKIDLLPENTQYSLSPNLLPLHPIFISAQNKLNLDTLKNKIRDFQLTIN